MSTNLVAIQPFLFRRVWSLRLLRCNTAMDWLDKEAVDAVAEHCLCSKRDTERHHYRTGYI